MKALPAASAFFLSELPHLERCSAGRPVLDLACGRGRQAVPAARRGLRVMGIDRDADSLRELAQRAAPESLPLSAVRADLESGRGIPAKSGAFGGILVFRFLFRPLVGAIVDALAPGGLLLYETFTIDCAELDYGPRNKAFLVQHGEFPELFAKLEIQSHWEGWTEGEHPLSVARLVARRRTA